MTLYLNRALRNWVLGLLAAFIFAAPLAEARPFKSAELTADTPLASFDKVYIAPVETDFSEHRLRTSLRDQRGIRPVSERDQARKANDLKRDIERELAKTYMLVDAPGPDVLTVSTTLTKLVSTRPTLADQTSGSVNLDFRSVYVGGAEYQVELYRDEALLGTIVATRIDRGRSLNDGLPRIGIWQDANRSFDRFSRKLARYIREH